MNKWVIMIICFIVSACNSECGKRNPINADNKVSLNKALECCQNRDDNDRYPRDMNRIWEANSRDKLWSYKEMCIENTMKRVKTEKTE